MTWRKFGEGMTPLEACVWAFHHASWFMQYETFAVWWNLTNRMAEMRWP